MRGVGPFLQQCLHAGGLCDEGFVNASLHSIIFEIFHL